jgi:ABC-type transport system substrate-binding protein
MAESSVEASVRPMLTWPARPCPSCRTVRSPPYCGTSSPFAGFDYTRDPEIRRLVEAGGATIDPDRRRKAYTAAIRLITEKASWVPIFTHTVTSGYSKELNFRPYPDELPRFFLASWK